MLGQSAKNALSIVIPLIGEICYMSNEVMAKSVWCIDFLYR